MKKLLMAIMCLCPLFMQASDDDSTTKIIRQQIQQNEIQDAINILNGLLNSYPNNADLIKWKANMLSWIHKNDSSIYILKQLPNYENDIEARNIVTTCLLRSNQLEQAFSNNTISLQLDSLNKDAILLDIQILFLQENWKSCIEKSKLGILNSTKAKEYRMLAANKLYTKKITLQYLNLQNINYTGQTIELGYQGKLKSLTYTFQLRKLSQLKTQSIQAQYELYKSWKKIGYTYATSALSDAKGFPLFYAGLVHFFSIQKHIESDFGLRYYKGKSQSATYVPSLGISLQINQIICQYRYYHIFNESFSGHTHTASVRKFFKKPEQYLKLEGATGIQTDQLSGQFIENQKRSVGQSLSISYQMPINLHINIALQAQYGQSTIEQKLNSKTVTSSIKLTYKFKTKK